MPHLLQADSPEETSVAGQTEDAPAGPGGFNPTTLLLLIVAAAFFWWSMRRRRVVEERLREQRRQETVTHAQESAQNVANIMRAGPRPGEAAAAATEGLASAARMPAARVAEPTASETETVTGLGAAAGVDESREDGRAQVVERAEALAQAERAAEEEARRAELAAQEAADSEARRLAAAAAAAEEARADTADALRAREREATEALREGLRELDNEVEAPLGAIAGDGTASCPPNFPIKGNAQSKIYHEPGQVSYPPTVPEFCFASAEAAEAAGFRQSRARGQRAQE
jgi:hypothetical protein